MTSREVALCFGTLLHADYFELVEAAATAGFNSLSVSPELFFDAREAGHSDQEMLTALTAAGLHVASVDPLISPLPGLPDTATLSPQLRRLFEFTEAACFEVAEALGAPVVNVAHPLGAEVADAELVDVLGGLATRAGQRGFGLAIEFMPSSASLHDYADARRVIDLAGVSNLAICFDTWHFFRAGSEPDDIEPITPGSVTVLQVCDAPAEAKGKPPKPMEDRLLPGDGAIPLREILCTILAVNPNLPVGVEVFSSELQTMTPTDGARRAFACIDRILAEV